MEGKEPNKNLAIPAAIVLAGLIIAVAIFIVRAPAPSVKKDANTQTTSAGNINIKAVSAADHILGNPDAPIIVVEYSDLECPYCKMFEGTMQTIMNTYGKQGQVAWVYRHFIIHSLAPNEADAAECANAQGGNTVFWNYISDVFATTSSMNNLNPSVLPAIAGELGLDVSKFNSCLSNQTYMNVIQADVTDGTNAGANGTPYSIMILKTPLSADTATTLENYIASTGLASNVSISSDNTKIALNGALPVDVLTKIIDTVLK
jgi:protein-disulfide isomerase